MPTWRWFPFCPMRQLALRVDRTIHFFFVFSVPVYIGFVHAFLGIRDRRWLEIIAWLLSIAFLTIVPTDLYFSGYHYYYFGRIARTGMLFHLFSATVAFTVLYCLTLLYRAMRRTADNNTRNRIKYIFGGLGFSAPPACFHDPSGQRRSRLSTGTFQLHPRYFSCFRPPEI